MPTSVLVYLHVVISKSAIFVGQCTIDQHFELFDIERFKSKNLRTRHERAVYVEERIVSSRPDEAESPCLNVGQENVLLCLVKMMNLVDEQNRLLPGGSESIRSGGDNTAHLSDIALHAADPNEFCVRHL